jgi:hypothetical protein
MRLRSVSASVIVALLCVVSGCGNPVKPSVLVTPPAISIAVMAQQGPRGGTLAAASSLVDLLGLLHGLGVDPSLDECNRFAQIPPIRAACWLDVKDPGNSLMIAAVLDEPCTVTTAVSGVLSLDEITITVVHTGSCSATPGAPKGGAQPAPTLSLLSIPLSALPASEITVNLVHTGASIPVARVPVDLRQPLTIHTNVEAVRSDVVTAISSAERDAGNRIAFPAQILFLGIGTGRWTDTSLGCPVAGQSVSSADARGYVVYLRSTGQPNTALEYHASGTQLAFCGQVTY